MSLFHLQLAVLWETKPAKVNITKKAMFILIFIFKSIYVLHKSTFSVSFSQYTSSGRSSANIQDNIKFSATIDQHRECEGVQKHLPVTAGRKINRGVKVLSVKVSFSYIRSSKYLESFEITIIKTR